MALVEVIDPDTGTKNVICPAIYDPVPYVIFPYVFDPYTVVPTIDPVRPFDIAPVALREDADDDDPDIL